MRKVNKQTLGASDSFGLLARIMADRERKKSSFNQAPKIAQHADAGGERSTATSVIGGDRKASLMKIEFKQGGDTVDGTTVAISKGQTKNNAKISTLGTAGADLVNNRRKQSLGKAKRIDSLRLQNSASRVNHRSPFAKCFPCCFPEPAQADVAVSDDILD
jgi:hypothetical protein